MKRFLRTVAGKTTLFIVCVLSVCILAASILGVAVMLYDAQDNFYTHTAEEIKNEFVERRFLNRGYGWVDIAFANDRTDDMTVNENYYYQVLDKDGNVILYSNGSQNKTDWDYSYSYAVKKDEFGNAIDFIYDTSPELGSFGDDWTYCSVNISIKENAPVKGEYEFYLKLIDIVYSLRYTIFIIGIAALVLAVVSFITLMCVSGHRPDTEEVVPGIFNKVPFDLILAICIAGEVGLAGLVFDIYYMSDITEMIAAAVLCFVGLCVFIGLCMSFASRVKSHTLVKNTVIWKLLVLAWKILCRIWNVIKRIHRFNMTVFHNLPIVWKTALAVFILTIFECILTVNCRYSSDFIFLFVLEKIIVALAVIYIAICLRKLQKGGIALANGDLSYVTDTKGLFLDLKHHGENLNSIAMGMGIAVDDRLKSERMKTELITNVSHDLKTPLTSIINYATLIGSEKCENEKITEYSEVLVRQSEKLKRLIEDLVEASKASTGNLEVNLAPCNSSIFLTQASGEYEDKLSKSELTLITKEPEKELRIMADGRRMWRIFDNLMNNICKYSLPGSRVYLSLEELDGKAVFTFKNTSKEALNISEEELMERFTRGDSSRNTEGNGLGLSIAKSMAQLQKGDLQISIDGDLFKAILSFPVI